jgi:crotonobetainyl-CoA:carnitine CoA-transferase CaiB-like acyl-CoA transferase
MAEQALAGIKVLDLGHHIAGPYCAKFLAGLGAEVIKIEPPGGDPARGMRPFPDDIPDSEKSGLFLYLNTSKKGITLNLKTETGKKIFKEMVKVADVLVENFEPRVMPSLGLDYQTLEKINPGLVMTSISNFGQNGPYRDWKATDITQLALGGLMYVTGDPDHEPLKIGGHVPQYLGGLSGFTGTLSALLARELISEGQQVDVAISDCVTAILDIYPTQWVQEGEIRSRMGNWQGGFGQGVYPCKDGYAGIFISTYADLPRVAKWTGIEEFNDERFKDLFWSRSEYSGEMNALLLPFLLEKTKQEIYHESQKLGLSNCFPATAQDIFEWPQYRDRGFFVEIDHPRAGKLEYPGTPAKMTETPYRFGPAPLLGQHNEDVYCGQLGYSKEDVIKLNERGII